jgi:uncharacterized membrane protein
MKKVDLTPFLNTRQNQLCLEVGGGDAIDAKSLGLLASNIAILIFTVQSSFHASAWITILIVLLAVSSLLDTIALWPRKYSGASVSAFDHPEYLAYDEETLVSQLIADTEEAITKNSRLNKQRLKYVTGSLIATVLASVILLFLL